MSIAHRILPAVYRDSRWGINELWLACGGVPLICLQGSGVIHGHIPLSRGLPRRVRAHRERRGRRVAGSGFLYVSWESFPRVLPL